MTKLLKSDCGKAWLFDAKKEGDELKVGFACFLSQCPTQLMVTMGKSKMELMTPAQAIDSPIALRIINARLSLLSLPL